MIVIADSDFGSVPFAYHAHRSLALGVIANVKVQKKWFPKEAIEELLEGCKAGSFVVLTATIGGVRMNAVGYKYARSKKTQCFICTVGDFVLWRPYIAKFKDQYFNTVSRPVPRPRVISVYYLLANRVDVHNQGRQDKIGLEVALPTRDGWFRMFSTFLGIVTENAWRWANNLEAKRTEADGGTRAPATISHSEYIQKLCLQMATVTELRALQPPDGRSGQARPPKVMTREAAGRTSPIANESQALVSASSSDAAGFSPLQQSEMKAFGHLHETVSTLPNRPDCVWCKHLHNQRSKTDVKCSHCKLPICRPHSMSGRECWGLHKEFGCPPAPKELKTADKATQLKWRRIAAEDLASQKKMANSGPIKAALASKERGR